MANRGTVFAAKQKMRGAVLRLEARERQAVLASIQQVCTYRGWTLVAAHVRTSHVHVVVGTLTKPAQPLHDLKAYASRALNRVEGRIIKRWATHGSTRYLWKERDVALAVKYVVDEQGEPMALYVAEPCQ